MKYQILNKKHGVLLDRIPEKVSKRLTLEFEGTKDGMLAVINTGVRVIYREIHHGACEIDNSLISEGKVLVMLKEAVSSAPPIVCDRLYAVRSESELLIMADETERDEIILELRKNISVLEFELEEANKKISALEKKYNEIFAGYEQL